MNSNKIKIGIYAPNLPKKELIGVLYIELNEPTERVYISELPKQSGFRSNEVETLIVNDNLLLTKFFDRLFGAANKIGATKGIVSVNGEIIFDAWFNPIKSRPTVIIPPRPSEIKVEIY